MTSERGHRLTNNYIVRRSRGALNVCRARLRVTAMKEVGLLYRTA